MKIFDLRPLCGLLEAIFRGSLILLGPLKIRVLKPLICKGFRMPKCPRSRSFFTLPETFACFWPLQSSWPASRSPNNRAVGYLPWQWADRTFCNAPSRPTSRSEFALRGPGFVEARFLGSGGKIEEARRPEDSRRSKLERRACPAPNKSPLACRNSCTVP